MASSSKNSSGYHGRSAPAEEFLYLCGKQETGSSFWGSITGVGSQTYVHPEK